MIEDLLLDFEKKCWALSLSYAQDKGKGIWRVCAMNREREDKVLFGDNLLDALLALHEWLKKGSGDAQADS